MVLHTQDGQCTVREGECVVCNVWHGDPCAFCGRRAFHALACPENDERDDVAHVDEFVRRRLP